MRVPDRLNIVFTNIKMEYTAPNLFFYPDVVHYTDPFNGSKHTFKHWLLDILEYLHNQYHEMRNKWIRRDDRIRFYIIVDEAWLIFNQHNRKNLSPDFLTHLFQIRKYNGWLFFCAQKYKNIAMQFREHVLGEYYLKPSFWSFLPRLKHQSEVRFREVDLEGNTLMYEYEAKDENGDRIVKAYPVDSKVQVFRRDKVRHTYDDLYFNSALAHVDPQLDYSPVSDHIGSVVKEVRLWYFEKKRKARKKTPKQLQALYPETTFKSKALSNNPHTTDDVVELIKQSLADN